MGIVITESGMRFGEYPEEQVFHLETSNQYRKQLMPNGIKSCEFILLRENKLYFVEAKSSCPRQITANTAGEKAKKYHEYIQGIVLKMKHSLTLYANILLQRYETEGVPELLRKTDLCGLQIILLLVIKNAEENWLIPLQDVLRHELKDEIKIWKVVNFYAINEEKARKKHFIF